ncbi:baseplate J/gp47 family protein [Plasticicumulans sp.]|uniref:baseplate assembly protein n=1 Tax=Plasticicumulans sp. TaxID=2307179 RepID=UPI002C04210B|nr:baseplate J/gp47 family protein [Plasticicumulans sp.]HNM43795.1 baseplate J/gp47 family protein [Plasticicumulans sp.]
MSTAIDLSQLPAPTVVETLDYESVLAALQADFTARYPAFTAALESEPVLKLLEVAAWRELIVRGRVNDAARACMLAYALGADLDHLAALYGVQRLLLDAGDPTAVPPVPPTYESDTRLRARTQLALEGFSTAGPVGAYEFWALSADAHVLDVSVQSPVPGQVLVTVLDSRGNGTPDAALLAAVLTTLSAEDVRPLTDQVLVQAAEIVPYTITAALTVYPGPDAATVRVAAAAATTAYAASVHRLGYDVTLSGLYAALHQPGVQRVALMAPAADLVLAAHQASWCTAVTVTLAGTAV